MAAESRINKEWAVRLLLIFVMATGFGAWFAYDGAIAWPLENKKAEIAYADKETRQLNDHWQDLLTARGFKPGSEPPKYRTAWDVNTQFLYAAACVVASLGVLVTLGRNARRPPRSDDRGVYRGSQFVPYDAITSIDKVRWDNKGIAVLYYKTADGYEGRMKLDDWVYRGAAAVLAEVEQHTHLGGASEKTA
ncbi:MAG: hypothetical protein ACYC26_00900 [Phycisphaerales bacterium]